MENKSNLMLVVYTAEGHTLTFYDCEQIDYHNKKLSFVYGGFSGKTTARFHHIAGITKHVGIKNPNIQKNKDESQKEQPK